MVGGTFSGKSTDNTIRNYAEMVIDDINSNQAENANRHWDKAREMDNSTAKKIFSQEYGSRIGKAYFNCITEYKIDELKKCWYNFVNTSSGSVKNPNPEKAARKSFIDKKIEEIEALVNSGLAMSPESADLHCAAAWAYVVHMGRGKPDAEDGKLHKLDFKGINEVSSSYSQQVYDNFKTLTEHHLNLALRLSPNNQRAIQVKEMLIRLDTKGSTSACFIATAAYGTAFASEIDVLRNWRDDFLEASYLGRLFTKTYYLLSPPVADNISESESKRKIVRTALGPIVKILKGRYSN